MAGKLIADQIEHSTAGSLDTSYVVNGSAKAHFHYSGTANVIRESLSISSISDDASGDFTVNISNSFADQYYVFTGHSAAPAYDINGTPTSSAINYISRDTSFAKADYSENCGSFMGDLA
jgi:hypothetical protein